MKKILITQIAWNSVLYAKALQLRNTDLRPDEGLEELKYAPESEASCIHIAALDGNKVVGTMHLEVINNREVKAKQVVVSQTCRGYGIGASMMTYAEELAIKLGYTILSLNGKEDAWQFYDKLGYIAYGEPRQSNKIIVKPYMKILDREPARKSFESDLYAV